jgi:hypothetical protein
MVPGITSTIVSETAVLTLLQVQSGHQLQLANISSDATLANIDDDYHGPVVI